MKRWAWGRMTFSTHAVDDPEERDLAWSCSRCGRDDHIRVRRGREVPTARTVKLLHAGKACDEAIAESVLRS